MRQNMKKYLELLTKHLNKILIGLFLVYSAGDDSTRMGVFIVFCLVEGILLQKEYVIYLKERKLADERFMEDLAKDLKEYITANFNVTVNKWLNLGDIKKEGEL